MENKSITNLPADVQERIKADADAYVRGLSIANSKAHQHAGYIAGATAERVQNESLRLQLKAQDANVEILLDNQKRFMADIEILNDEINELEKENDKLNELAQVLIDALEAIAANSEHPGIKSFATKALEQVTNKSKPMNVNLNNTDNNDYVRGYKDGKKAGATAENERTQVLIDALEAIIKSGENIRSIYKTSKPAFYIKVAHEAIEQWKRVK